MQTLNKMIWGCAGVCLVNYWLIAKITYENWQRQNYLTTKFIRRWYVR